MFEDLEGRLGHKFSNPDFLKIALTHRSHYFENKATSLGHFERFEFLGDAVLDLTLSELLMNRFPEVDEGTLSKWRASLVNETSLSEIACQIQLKDYLFLGKSEDLSRELARPRLLASAFEAILAATYKDAGIEATRDMVERLFQERIGSLDSENGFATDYKTRLQEHSQKRYHTTPEYRLVQSEGPEHLKKFIFEVWVHGKACGQGEGTSRKSAEQKAAQAALVKIKGEQK